jgi:DNA-directed RNA polymerase subunit E'/Rpb7
MPPSKTNSMIARIQNKIKNPNQPFNKELEELDEIVSKLKKEYIRNIKSETQQIILKYDGIINEIVEKYNNESNNESNEENGNMNERDTKLKELYNNRDIELIQLKLKYIELAEQEKKSKKTKGNETKGNEGKGNETKGNESKGEVTKEDEELTPFNMTPLNQVNINAQNPNLYVNSLIHKRVSVPFSKIGNNMNEYFRKYSEVNFEGKCHKEGYFKPFSTNIISYTTGLLKYDNVIYDVVYSIDICIPYENMEVVCKIKNITKIGIRGIISEENNPIILFISREHNASKNFDDYEEGQLIKIKIIGHRFEINDENISVIGEII